jgi:hypothetical protein
LFLLRTYLALPFLWPLIGKQFLIVSVAGKDAARPDLLTAKP